MAKTQRDIAKARVPTAAAVDGMNVCRAELRHQFSRLDAVFRLEIENMWNDFAKALRDTTQLLLRSNLDGKQTLLLFKERCENSDHNCEKLVRACEAVLATQISLRVNFMPCITKAMQQLDPAKNPPDLKADPGNRDLGDKLKIFLDARCRLAISATSKSILEEGGTVDSLLYAIVVHGNDLFIRSQGITSEYEKLVRAWGPDIDPKVFEQAVSSDVTYKKWRAAIQGIHAALMSVTDR